MLFRSPKILKPREFKALLRKATPQTLPAFIFGGFCGLRLGEIQELHWEDVDFNQNTIMVDKANNSSSRRLVPLPGAASAWLAPITKESGRVIDSPSLSTLSAQMLRVWRDSKCPATLHCLRYSAVSYRLSLDGETKTAAEFNFSLKMLIAIFQKLVTKRQAKAWFAILPPN